LEDRLRAAAEEAAGATQRHETFREKFLQFREGMRAKLTANEGELLKCRAELLDRTAELQTLRLVGGGGVKLRPQRTAADSSGAVEAATRALQAQVEEQRRTVASLRAQLATSSDRDEVERLKAELKSLGRSLLERDVLNKELVESLRDKSGRVAALEERVGAEATAEVKALNAALFEAVRPPPPRAEFAATIK
jgi:hypothetical protein